MRATIREDHDILTELYMNVAEIAGEPVRIGHGFGFRHRQNAPNPAASAIEL
ncbi:hypothetical protein [Sphingobium nicotianae]|uniref:Uncharacterized protein n=1 Tax=Sphingobium nicotianae TaxID=2782607 RepID=A0A9X1DCB5_9SPHN|nr:hypothetical protein [Sphingobium nicotianae]MBT2187357.1 hypothetical protein [Sphingobium nicotianae]